MRYPMIRENRDGTLVVVNNPTEAYADPDQIAAFRPELPIPEAAPAVEPVKVVKTAGRKAS